MANIMSLKDRQNHVQRNGFDLSRSNLFTAKVGELLPVYVEDCVPGTKKKVPVTFRTRTIPLNTAAYTKIKEYYDFFFVPYRLLWRFSDTFFIDGNDSYVASDPITASRVEKVLPTVSRNYLLEKIRDLKLEQLHENEDVPYSDIFGRSRADNICKLLEYLDYGRFDALKYIDAQVNEDGTDHSAQIKQVTAVDFVMNIFAVLAYQKVYNDYYRFGQWERNQPQSYNIDYVTDDDLSQMESLIDSILTNQNTAFDLRYCNWHKDLFMGLIPQAQYGDEASAVVFGNGLVNLDVRLNNGNRPTSNTALSLYPYSSGRIGIKNASNSEVGVLDQLNLTDQIGNLPILALRQAEALQKWKEISFSGNEDYRTQIKKHFNVDPGPVRSRLCEFIDGFSGDININAVINNNLTSQDDIANIKGMGTSDGDNYFEYEAKEHGIILGIYHAQPLLDYAAIGCNPIHLATRATDYVIPEFDKIGMQSVPQVWLNADMRNYIFDTNEVSSSLGYAPRYIDKKTAVSKVRGGFLRGLSNWSASYDQDMIENVLRANYTVFGKPYSYITFKVPPFALDKILSVKHDAYADSNSDHLICQVNFDDKSIQPIDRDGLPY